MKHAGKDALDQVERLLERIRERHDLRERKRGIFYRKSKAFLHFHDDPAGIFADLRETDGEFHRYPVNSDPEFKALLKLLDKALGH